MAARIRAALAAHLASAAACAAFCLLVNAAAAVFLVCTFGTEWLQ